MKTFYTNCVNFPKDRVQDLSDMIDSGRQITRKTFLKHVDPVEMKEMESFLGYEKYGLRMANDYYVSYWKGRLCGKETVWFRHSAIEYIFV